MAEVKESEQRFRSQLQVDVSSDIITKSSRRDSSHCMIADAIQAALPVARSVSVDLATIRFTEPKKGRRFVYLTPPGAQRALILFDQGGKVDPFVFTLRRPVQVLLSGQAQGGKVSEGTRVSKAKRVVVSKKSHPIIEGGEHMANAALSNARGRIRAHGLRQSKP